MTLLRYTGHPFVDVGVATITAFCKRRAPEFVSEQDLDSVADYLKDIYSNIPQIRNQLNTVFQGSHFTQPKKSKEDRIAYAERLMYGFRSSREVIAGVYCTFFPEKPAFLYAHRQYFPLLNGVEIANFSPLGRPGIPISGVAMLAIHAMPLGCLKCGNLLAFHQLKVSNDVDVDMMLLLANEALLEYRKNIQVMRLDANVKLPNLSFIRTRYVEAILRAQQTAQRRRVNIFNITGYYFTNFANNADLKIVRLDNSIMEFINVAQQDVGEAWRRAVWRSWRLEKGETPADLAVEATAVRRNELYEQLFELPRNARRFLRRLAQVHSWPLIEIFLRKVLHMEQERIDTYRKLGDKLADYMVTYEGDSMGFYYNFSREDNYAKFRRVLRRAAERMVKADAPDPLFTYEEFIAAFEHPSQGYSQWKLGRDLIAFRILEMLSEQGVDASQLPDDEVDADADDEE